MGRAPKMCSERGCTALVYDPSRRRCETHHVPWANHGWNADRADTTARKRLKEKIFRRDGYRCQLQYPGVCEGFGSELDRIDHTRGYEDEQNLQCVCRKCHQKKTSHEAHQTRWGTTQSNDV